MTITKERIRSLPEFEVGLLLRKESYYAPIHDRADTFSAPLVGLVLDYAYNPNQIVVAEMDREIDFMADVKGSITGGEPAYMQVRWFKPEYPVPSGLSSVKYNYLRRANLRVIPGSIRNGLLQEMEEGASYPDNPQYIKPQEKPLVTIDSVDAISAKGRRHGEYVRKPVVLADLIATDNPDIMTGEATHPWIGRFIMEFERVRNTLAGFQPVYSPRRQEVANGHSYTIDLKNGQLIL